MRVLKVTALFLATAFASDAHGQVVNPNFDTSAQGWSILLDSGEGGFVDWDSTIGYPTPGSARAGNVFPGAHVDGWKQCVPISGSDYAFSAAVASAVQTGNSCRINVDFIADQDCVDGTPIALEVRSSNTQNNGAFELLGSGGILPEGILAAALSLDHIRVAGADAGSSDCHFDHVQLGADTIFAANFD
ncbi:MAG TPA: hypothetical protein VGH81_01880 [Rudaea sp.]|jgi:hypothetical protein